MGLLILSICFGEIELGVSVDVVELSGEFDGSAVLEHAAANIRMAEIIGTIFLDFIRILTSDIRITAMISYKL